MPATDAANKDGGGDCQRAGEAPCPLLFGADAGEFGLEDAQCHEDGEGEADDARDAGQGQRVHDGNVLANDQEDDQREDGNDFVRTDEHGLPLQQTALADAADARGYGLKRPRCKALREIRKRSMNFREPRKNAAGQLPARNKTVARRAAQN